MLKSVTAAIFSSAFCNFVLKFMPHKMQILHENLEITTKKNLPDINLNKQ
jgi:hypothetical protein